MIYSVIHRALFLQCVDKMFMKRPSPPVERSCQGIITIGYILPCIARISGILIILGHYKIHGLAWIERRVIGIEIRL